MISTSEIRAIAKAVWDDIYHVERTATDADLAFLEALSRADKRCSRTLADANIRYGVKSDTYRAVKNLAIRQHAAEYLAAYRTYEAAGEAEEVRGWDRFVSDFHGGVDPLTIRAAE
jgi:hypothetical protein